MLDRLVGADRLAEGRALLGVVDRHLHHDLRAGRVLGRQREQDAVAQPRPQGRVVHREPLGLRVLEAHVGHLARDVAPRQQVDLSRPAGAHRRGRRRDGPPPRPGRRRSASRPRPHRSRTTSRRSAGSPRAVHSRHGPSVAPLASATATASFVVPAATPGSSAVFCSGEPPFWIAQVPNRVPRNGLGARLRPISPRIIARSMQERPRPS